MRQKCCNKECKNAVTSARNERLSHPPLTLKWFSAMCLHIIFYFSFILSLVACSSNQKKEIPPATNVTDYIVEAKTIPVIFNFIGFAASSHPVEIRARVEGYLSKIAYTEGQMVQQGDLLFQLDPNQYKAKVEQAKGEVARQEALLENAILTVNRLTPLYKQKAASKKDLDNATANKLAVEASLQSVQAQLLDNEINLGYTTITSPITGLADKSRYHEGALINPGSNSLLTTISVIDPIWIYFTVSDNDILRAREQSASARLKLPNSEELILPKENEYIVKITLSNGSIYPEKGKLDFSSPAYDQSTGTLLARAVFPNSQMLLLPGQFVKVQVYGAERSNAILVPRRALMQKKDGMFVYLINQDNQIIAQDVSVEEWFEDYQVISNGLKVGDHIVVDGINKVYPGASVHITGKWSQGNEIPK